MTRHSCNMGKFLAMVAVMVLWIQSSGNILGIMADPILAPELRYCFLPQGLPVGEPEFDCCAPNWNKPAINFHFQKNAHLKLKIRRPAHTMDHEYSSKVDKAYALMKALPSHDPRSFMQQANIHCAYCGSTYQMGNSSTPLQVHASWLFFSFHRWYLYFHERILAKLLGDDTFALPFWNYDHPDGMTIPSSYMKYPNLYDPRREPTHLPPAIVMLDYYINNASIRTSQEQVLANLATIYRQVVTGAPTPYKFFGQPYRKGDKSEPGYGTLETMPHNSVHGWTGDTRQIGKKDMGTLYAAGRDPVFYTHHANLDRLWDVWKSLGHQDIDDPDYLESEFVFYNEDAELVKVKIKDSFDTLKLGYKYQAVENVWLNQSTTRLSHGVATLSASAKLCKSGKELTKKCSVVVTRNKTGAVKGQETLVIEGIKAWRLSAAMFEVFVNLPEASVSTMKNCSEYVGRFSFMGQQFVTSMSSNYLSTTLRLAISSNLKDLDLTEAESVVVTLVPLASKPYGPVSISGIKLE